MQNEATFSFGKNWQIFLSSVNDAAIESAKKSLTSFLGLSDLKSKSFLDAGCGSGLFSYAAHLLGAKKIVSFDLDPYSVQCCKYFWEKAGKPDSWEIHRASVLDTRWLNSLGTFDVVYSWGVLHHTGEMWQAIKNVSRMVNTGGYLYIALYNKVPGPFGSSLWLKIVKLYNRSSSFGKFIMEQLYVINFILRNLIRLKNPWKKMRNHRHKRGMDWFVDVKDDLGGYPYEYASVDEVFNYVKHEFPDFDLVKLHSVRDRGNNKLVFRNMSKIVLQK